MLVTSSASSMDAISTEIAEYMHRSNFSLLSCLALVGGPNMTAKKNFIAIRLCLSFVALLAATNDILNNLTINLWVSMEGKVAKLEEVMDALNGNPEERKKLHADPVSYLQSKGVVLKGVTNNQVVARAKRMENVQTEWGYDAIVTPNEEETKQK